MIYYIIAAIVMLLLSWAAVQLLPLWLAIIAIVLLWHKGI